MGRFIKSSTAEYLKLLGRAFSIGMAMVLAVAIGFILGWLVDGHWPNISPWGKIIGLAFGVAATYRNLFIMFRRINKQMNK